MDVDQLSRCASKRHGLPALLRHTATDIHVVLTWPWVSHNIPSTIFLISHRSNKSRDCYCYSQHSCSLQPCKYGNTYCSAYMVRRLSTLYAASETVPPSKISSTQKDAHHLQCATWHLQKSQEHKSRALSHTWRLVLVHVLNSKLLPMCIISVADSLAWTSMVWFLWFATIHGRKVLSACRPFRRVSPAPCHGKPATRNHAGDAHCTSGRFHHWQRPLGSAWWALSLWPGGMTTDVPCSWTGTQKARILFSNALSQEGNAINYDLIWKCKVRGKILRGESSIICADFTWEVLSHGAWVISCSTRC